MRVSNAALLTTNDSVSPAKSHTEIQRGSIEVAKVVSETAHFPLRFGWATPNEALQLVQTL